MLLFLILLAYSEHISEAPLVDDGYGGVAAEDTAKFIVAVCCPMKSRHGKEGKLFGFLRKMTI